MNNYSNTIRHIIVTIIVFCINDLCAQNNFELKAINYNAITRGGSIIISITPNEKKYSDFNNHVKYKIDNEFWEYLKSIIKEINLEEIKTLKSPSNLRFSDATLSANISFVVNDKVYISNTFDHKNPPTQLKKITELLIMDCYSIKCLKCDSIQSKM